METPASIKGHPIHPMLIPLPIGLWVFSFVCQIIGLATHNAVWVTVAMYSAGGGVLGALIAAVPGFIDLLSITDDHVRGYALKHMIANLTAAVIWAISCYFLLPQSFNQTIALVLAVIGVLLITYSGWLGGDMVYRHWVAVKPASETKEAWQQGKKSS